RVPISEVLSELRAEETRLHGAGLLQVPSVLAARGATPPVSSRSSAPPLLPTPLGSEVRSREGRSRPRTHCDYCNRDGHPESDCFKKKCDMRNRERNSSSGTRASSSTLSTVSLTEQDIVKLKRLLAASGSSTGTTGSVTGASSVERPLSTQSGQLTNSGCRVILDVDSCTIQDRHTKAQVGADPRRRDSQGLWELDWLNVPSATTTLASPSAFAASATSSFQQWHHRLGRLCGSRLSSLVRRGLLGPVSRDVSLQCQGCRLGKQVQLPYPTSESVSQRPFDLVHSDVWG
uniref:GAG-pre-integrase domain-containing protein n=1 Tax=Aegilops tauschii subsp. strangulata TaxID=200361 RepID=A0A452Y461_AEGTS